MKAKLNDIPSNAHFKCGYDEVWQKMRKYGAHHDVHIARHIRDDFESCFCGGEVEFNLPTQAEIDRAFARRADRRTQI